MRWSSTLLLLIALLLSSACGRKARVAKPPLIGASESGVASWYGHPYHGRRAANGEIYDMEKMTAAHRTLPFSTWVRVENVSNNKTVDVRITDRGPFVDGRIIDLSRAAARDIEMLGPGTAKVRLTVIQPPKDLPPQELFAVQVGAFQDLARAQRVRDEMQRFATARLVERPANPVVWRVLVGEEHTPAAASALAERIRSAGTDAFVVRLDLD